MTKRKIEMKAVDSASTTRTAAKKVAAKTIATAKKVALTSTPAKIDHAKAPKMLKPLTAAQVKSAKEKVVASVTALAPAVTARKVVADTARAYLPAADRRKLMDAAIAELLKRDGIAALTRTAAAAACGVSNGLIGTYYANAAGLKIAAVQYAADAGDLKTVKKAIADGFQAKLLTRKAQRACK